MPRAVWLVVGAALVLSAAGGCKKKEQPTGATAKTAVPTAATALRPATPATVASPATALPATASAEKPVTEKNPPGK